MKYRLLGNSGLRVSELALGAMTFGMPGWGVEKDESRRVYEGFREAGGNFIDTANLYSGGRSEKFLGEFLAGERERIVLATKYTGAMRTPGRQRVRQQPQEHDGRGAREPEAAEHRLHRPLLGPRARLHHADRGGDARPRRSRAPGQGPLRRGSPTRRPGRSRARTCSPSCAAGRAFVGLQIKYSLLDRSVERELLPMAKALDLAVTPWDTLGSGSSPASTTATRRTEGRAALRGRAISERDLAIAAEVMQVAEEIGRTPAQVALNWVRQRRA